MGIAELSIRKAGWVLVGCLLAVAALKRHSPTSCPWSLQEFGGHAVYLSHWRWRPDGGPGHCFPSGHASGASCCAHACRASRAPGRSAW